MMLRGRVSKQELAAPQDGAHAILRCLPHLGEGEPRWVGTTGPGGHSQPQRQRHPSPGKLGTYLGLGMNAEAQ